MLTPEANPTHSGLASSTDPKASQIDANLKLATENAQPISLRQLLQELRHTQPDAHKVTGALLLATQQKYTEKIKASKGTQSDEDAEEEEEEEEEEDEDTEDESESDGSSDARDISELSLEEEEDDEDSIDDSDVDMKKSELGSGEEDDGTDEEEGSTTTSTRHIPVKSELQRKA